MKLKTPFYFTKEGRGWRTSSVPVTLIYEDGMCVATAVLKKSHLKRGNFEIAEGIAFGYYVDQDTGEKIRITNIVGYQNGQFLKWCPHCERTMTLEEFDYSGRFTGEQRDQSNCSDCRSSY